MRKLKGRTPLYPLLIAAFPILHIYANNVSTTSFSEIVRPLGLSLAATLVLLYAVRLILRDPARTGVLVSIIVFLCSSYGHGLRVASRLVTKAAHVDMPLWALSKNLNAWFLPAWVLVLVLAAVLVIRARNAAPKIGSFLTVMGLALVVLPLCRAATCGIGAKPEDKGDPGWQAAIAAEVDAVRNGKPAQSTPHPDIYYIILDAYARNDVLSKTFGYDNTDFTDYLSEKGFYVAELSRSNYHCTPWSLATSLNLDYLDALREPFSEKWVEVPLQAIWNNKVSRILRERGYKYIAMNSGWAVTSGSPYADIDMPKRGLEISELERALIERSVLSIWWPRFLDSYLRRHTIGMFDDLAAVSKLPEATFTLAHIVCPHDPYVFDRDGNLPKARAESESLDDYLARLYVDQVHYVNVMVRRTIETILSNSVTPPVIIVQSDHGSASVEFWRTWYTPEAAALSDEQLASGLRDRVRILNAYYFPGVEAKGLHESISPVNSFRILLNEYFGANYDTLEDVTYIPRSGSWAETASTARLRVLPPLKR